MIPHTLVLKPGLVIHSIYNGYWFWGRPSIDELRQDLRAVTREIRPDWDLGAPGLREAWDTGDVSRFHGWSRWSRERVAAERERVARAKAGQSWLANARGDRRDRSNPCRERVSKERVALALFQRFGVTQGGDDIATGGPKRPPRLLLPTASRRPACVHAARGGTAPLRLAPLRRERREREVDAASGDDPRPASGEAERARLSPGPLRFSEGCSLAAAVVVVVTAATADEAAAAAAAGGVRVRGTPGATAAVVIAIAIGIVRKRRWRDAEADQREPSAMVPMTVPADAMAGEATVAAFAVPLLRVVDHEHLAGARRRGVIRVTRVVRVPVIGSWRRERDARRVWNSRAVSDRDRCRARLQSRGGIRTAAVGIDAVGDGAGGRGAARQRCRVVRRTARGDRARRKARGDRRGRAGGTHDRLGRSRAARAGRGVVVGVRGVACVPPVIAGLRGCEACVRVVGAVTRRRCRSDGRATARARRRSRRRGPNTVNVIVPVALVAPELLASTPLIMALEIAVPTLPVAGAVTDTVGDAFPTAVSAIPEPQVLVAALLLSSAGSLRTTSNCRPARA